MRILRSETTPLGHAPDGWTRLEFPGVVPPSLNEYLREYRHWAKRRRLRRTWAWRLTVELARVAPGVTGPDQPKMSVNVIIYRPRRLDKDGAYGGCKPVLDAMRDVGLIRNDSERWLDLGVSQMIGPPKTVIEFRECK